jgi:DNA-binding CsgD family transcriptional regulator
VKRLLERERELGAVDDLLGRGGVLVIEAGAGLGKTSLIHAASRRAGELGYETLTARGSELEAGFAFGVVRQLFERRAAAEPEELLSGPAAAARPVLTGAPAATPAGDTAFAVVHGLYWLAANLAARAPLLIAVDDAHWADGSSLRWLAYLAPRVEGLPLALLVASRPLEPAATDAGLLELRREARAVVRPALLSEAAVAAVVRASVADAGDELCRSHWTSTGGNPLYLDELLRGDVPVERVIAGLPAPHGLGLAQALAILGDGCELRHAAALAGVGIEDALQLAAGLVRAEVLATTDPPRFVHPVVRDAIDASLADDQRDAAHRKAARLLHADGAPPGRVAVHLMAVRPAGDGWVLSRLREAAKASLEAGAPQVAADLLRRALAEPPGPAERIDVLREAARAETTAGGDAACEQLEAALATVAHPRTRAAIALEVGEAYASLFRWVDAVEVLDRALEELGDTEPALAARLEGELVVCGLHDARGAPRARARLAAHEPTTGDDEALVVARGMLAFLAGRPAEEIAPPLEAALARDGEAVENWDTRAALLWVLVATERFDAVEAALYPILDEVHGSGSARGLVATYSTLGLLELRRGALPEADAAARVALRVMQDGHLAPGLAFAATVLAQVAVEAGDLDEAQTLLDLLPREGLPAGVGTVLIPAARGRLRLAQGRPGEALADFEACLRLFDAAEWGLPIRETGYVHARSGTALALLRLGEPDRARALADAELADVRVLGTPRALGVALRAAGLAHGGATGLDLLRESAGALDGSPALLERAHSLAELGAALRRAGQRAAAREPLAEALDLAARCGARPLAARAREELTATGARPRRPWRTGVESLTPSELRVARLAAEGRTNREIAHELYVTPKTVEGHLARTYAKLGIAGRGELRAALEGEKTRVPTL